MNKIHTFIYVCLLLFFGSRIHAQGEAKQWYFGNYGINFLTNPVTILNNGAMYPPQGSATISDALGQLLFYTDNDTIYNASHHAMANGGLSNPNQSAQPAIIIKKPGSSAIYYVFSENGGYSGGNNGLKYSTVDMSLAAGLGSVTALNTNIDTTASTQKLTATNHCNGHDVWVMTHDQYSNHFKAYLVTAAGVNTVPVVSSIGQAGIWSTSGQMKFSPNGKKIAYCASYTFEMYDFDNSLGIVSNSLTLASGFISTGCEFSPDGTKVYETYSFGSGCHLRQWDLCAPVSFTTPQYHAYFQYENYGAMQLAPDGKIYVGGYSNNAGMGTINFPDIAGSSCGFSNNPLITDSYGMPNFNSSYFKKSPIPLQFIHLNLACRTVEFTGPVRDTSCAAATNISRLSWSFGDPASGAANTSTLTNPVHVFSQGGTFTTELVIFYECGSDTTREIIIAAPCTGIEEKSQAENSLTLYPVPATDNLTVQFTNPTLVKNIKDADIYNHLGQLIKQTSADFKDNALEINTADLPNGVYLLVIKYNDHKALNKKFIISRF